MFIGEMRFLMAVRFCFVRVLFALNIYVHGGVGSATRILCGIDTERTGGGGGGSRAAAEDYIRESIDCFRV